MITFVAYAMVIVFIYLLTKKKLTVYSALALVPLVFGIFACLVTGKPVLDIFVWIKDGVFYSVNPTTKAVKMGVISSASLILFAVLYFNVMLKAGLFDPLCIFFIKRAKGDPLKVTMATVMVASMVTLDGDTTTTIIVCLAAFLTLYKRMGIKLSYLAILITMPIGIFNQLPWGGPLVASAAALNVDMSVLFQKLLPGMLVAEAYVIFAAYLIGKKERQRLNFDPSNVKEISKEHLDEMIASVRDFEPDFKRPKLFFLNLILTIAVLTMLIMDLAHGGVLFMVASALALAVNYSKVDDQMALLRSGADDVLIPALATLAAGAFTGILGSSGMSKAIANSIISIIPQSLGTHMAPIYALIAAPAICFLPQDAFYYGIAALVAPIAGQFGISPQETAVASMVGQAFRLASPVIPALYILTDRTEMNFVDYQKLFFKWTTPVLFIYLIMHTLTGAMPF
jgi:citrate-Mg2+:H+ or citrate-Ca2+:H+ symporter, CitMHS family